MSDRIFAWSPSPDYTVSHEEKVDEVSFGDGYEAAIPRGINFRRRIWPLVFQGPSARADEIESFLDDHAGGGSFLWVVPESGQQIRVKYKPGSRSRRTVTLSAAAVGVTFVEVFE